MPTCPSKVFYVHRKLCTLLTSAPKSHITSTSGLTSYSFLNFVLFWLIQLASIFALS